MATAPGTYGGVGSIPGMTAARSEVTEIEPPPVKPRLRGWLHAGMFPAALVAGIVLTVLADSTRGKIACGIYAVTACLLFGVSALYHRGDWGRAPPPYCVSWTTPISF